MKNLFKNSYIALAVLALGFSACTEEVEYNPAEVPATAQVYFSNTNGAQIDLAKEATSFDIAVSRAEAGAAASIDVYVTADESANAVFDFPATVEFADSAVSAVYTVNVKEGVELEYSVFHNINLSIDESLATPYGNSSYTFQVGVPAPWSEWAAIAGHETATYTFTQYVSGSYPVEVSYREHQIETNRAQFMFYTTGIGTLSDFVVEYDKNTGMCQVPAGQAFLTHSTYGPVFVSDLVNYPFVIKDGDGNPIEMTYENQPCTYDAETGLFTLNLIYYIDKNLGSSASGYFAYGTETIQLAGFKQYDYSLAMQYRGNYVDNNGTNNAVISTTKGVDVAKYLMTVISADEDANAAIQGMLKGEVPCDTLTEGGFYAYPIAESGKYKALAITFDAEGNALEAYSTDFEFWVAGDSNPWQSLGYAMYTDDVILPLFGNPVMSYYVEVLENKDQPGLFRMVDPYGPEFPLYPYASSYAEGSYIEIDATDAEGVWIEGWQTTGLDVQNNGLMDITSMAWYQANAQGATKEDAKEAGFCGIYAEGVITFPVDGILTGIGGKAYYSNRNGAFALDLNTLVESIPAEVAAARSAAGRTHFGFNLNYNFEMGVKKAAGFKKIDNSFLTLKDAVIE